jgi:DNA (cytosine-5)-methyltransferase 1
MGVRETYKIPGGYNDGYRAMGDAVAVPVVRHLGRTLLYPLALRVRE